MSNRSKRRLSALVEGEWWRDLSACRGTDTNLWFERSRRADALAVCRECPVSNLCLDYALAFETEFGIWGGFTPTQRIEYRAELKAFVASRLRQGIWGAVPVLGSDDGLEQAE